MENFITYFNFEKDVLSIIKINRNRLEIFLFYFINYFYEVIYYDYEI